MISSLLVSMMRLKLSSIVEKTKSAERMILSLVLSVGRGGSGGGRESEIVEEGVRPAFSLLLGGRFGGTRGVP